MGVKAFDSSRHFILHHASHREAITVLSIQARATRRRFIGLAWGYISTKVTRCCVARGSDVLTSEYHKTLRDVLTSKLRRRPRVHHQHVLDAVCYLPRSLFPNFSTAFVSSQLCFFALSRFEFCTAYQNRARLFIFFEMLLVFKMGVKIF